MDSVEGYEIHAKAFLQGRDVSKIGSRIVEQWTRTLPQGATVIELACGGGFPITRVLQEAGLRVWAVDSSPTLLGEFRKRFPMIPARCERVQDSDFFAQKYHAAVAIGLLFLLSDADQESMMMRVAQALLPNGRFLFMAPIQAGTWKDLNTGLECTSLGYERYTQLMGSAGFRLLSTCMDKGDNNYYEAELI